MPEVVLGEAPVLPGGGGGPPGGAPAAAARGRAVLAGRRSLAACWRPGASGGPAAARPAAPAALLVFLPSR